MIYVDDMRLRKKIRGCREAIWSHMFADSTDELIAFAEDQLGMRRQWLQKAGTRREHFDVTETNRLKAISLGAISISFPSGTALLLRERRQTGWTGR